MYIIICIYKNMFDLWDTYESREWSMSTRALKFKY